jgi:hypothetical protein
MVGFNSIYQNVFAAVVTALGTKTSIKSIILGEAFSLGDLPKVIINAEGSPIDQATLGSTLNVKVNFSVICVIRDYMPKDWFIDIIPVMADVVDAILADRSLRGTVMDVTPTGFYPGEIKFGDDKVLFGGVCRFSAELLYTP